MYPGHVISDVVWGHVVFQVSQHQTPSPRKPSCVVDPSPTQVQTTLPTAVLASSTATSMQPLLPWWPAWWHSACLPLWWPCNRPMNTLDHLNGSTTCYHPLLQHSSTSSSYLILFLSWASSMQSFQGMVNSEMGMSMSGLSAMAMVPQNFSWFFQLQVWCRC